MLLKTKQIKRKSVYKLRKNMGLNERAQWGIMQKNLDSEKAVEGSVECRLNFKFPNPDINS